MPAYEGNLFSPPAPLARVTLRNPSGGNTAIDVPMLIDSGADITLIPETSINLLGVTVDAQERYELMSFDGTRSTAQVVHLDMIFLKRVFRGRFLLISQGAGILGRDILNHLPLILDGPNLTWDEHKPPAK